MKKFILKVVIITALVVATILLAANEIKAIGTITGLTLVPFAAALVWSFLKMIVSDLKSFNQLVESAEDE